MNASAAGKEGTGNLANPLTGIRYKQYGLEGGPYLGFPEIHDVYGDGSIVVVPAPGHTPGQRDYIRVAAQWNALRVRWQLGMAAGRHHSARSPAIRISDAEGTRENLLRMIAIKERLPELIIVPAHDERLLPKCRCCLRQAARPAVRDRGT